MVGVVCARVCDGAAHVVCSYDSEQKGKAFSCRAAWRNRKAHSPILQVVLDKALSVTRGVKSLWQWIWVPGSVSRGVSY